MYRALPVCRLTASPARMIPALLTLVLILGTAALTGATPAHAAGQDSPATGGIGQAVPVEDRNPDLIHAAEGYFNGLTTVHAHFVQQYDTGETASGDFYLQRPGKLRFEYQHPNDSFIVADGLFLYFWDAELKQVSQAPIGSTLANFLLRDHISLEGTGKAKTGKAGTGSGQDHPDKVDQKPDESALMVTDSYRLNGEIYLTMQLADDPAQGSLTVVLSDQPLQLRRWIVRDAQGYTTTVTMSDWTTSKKLDKDLFFFSRPDFAGRDK